MRALFAPIAAGLLLAALVGCAGRSVEDVQESKLPRPPYGSLTLSLEGQTQGLQTRTLYLDRGDPAFPKQYPVQVGNHKDLQNTTLWRYDFIEIGAPSPSECAYATLLIRVDDVAASGYVSFWGRAGTYPVYPYTLNPRSLFGAQDVPDTPANRKDSAAWLFVRFGNPVRLPDPQVIGKVGPYRILADTTTVVVGIPGMDFPVGGVTLDTTDGQVSVAGTVDDLTDLGQSNGSDAITTPATTVDAERVQTADRVSPVTAEWDLLFGWQPPKLGFTITHGAMADPTLVPDPYASGSASFTGGGFFATTLPGVPSPINGRNILDWTVLRSSSDSAWILGWSAEVAATRSVTAGQNGGIWSTLDPGSGVVSAQVRGYLAGTMHPSARIVQFQGAQDKGMPGIGNALLYEATKIPMLARNPRATATAQMSQLVIGGRTLWYRKGSQLLGADVTNSDQSLVDRYGTLASFSAYLPIP